MIAAMDFPPVAARGLVKGFGALRVLAGLDLDVLPGTCVAIVGPNGAGKTTLLRLLAGIARPTRGSVRLFGEDCGRNGATAPVRARIGMVAHEPMIYRDLTVRENLELFAALYPARDAAAASRVERAIDGFGLGMVAERPARTLSRGYLQRLALGRATLHDPELLLLDEPLTGLDATSRDRAIEQLGQHRTRGTQILVSHDPADLSALATSIFALQRGKLEQIADRRVDETAARQMLRALGAAT